MNAGGGGGVISKMPARTKRSPDERELVGDVDDMMRATTWDGGTKMSGRRRQVGVEGRRFGKIHSRERLRSNDLSSDTSRVDLPAGNYVR